MPKTHATSCRAVHVHCYVSTTVASEALCQSHVPGLVQSGRAPEVRSDAWQSCSASTLNKSAMVKRSCQSTVKAPRLEPTGKAPAAYGAAWPLCATSTRRQYQQWWNGHVSQVPGLAPDGRAPAACGVAWQPCEAPAAELSAAVEQRQRDGAKSTHG